MPETGETMGARNPDCGYMLPGGKGANQAVAAQRLSKGAGIDFVCQFGSDSHATKLKETLIENSVGIEACGYVDKPSGQAFIFLDDKGNNSIILSAAANAAWPKTLSPAVAAKIKSAKVVMLQREVAYSIYFNSLSL